jgi:menaquinone-9 beta-reductase
MKSKYDVIVVGGRVAGTSLAIQLARLGMDVVIFDRARLPGDTMSTHVIYPNTIARLDNLGVLDRVMAHRPPPLYTAWYHQNRMFVSPHTPEAGRDWPYAFGVRRLTVTSRTAREKPASTSSITRQSTRYWVPATRPTRFVA